jgi:hypothetical protein
MKKPTFISTFPLFWRCVDLLIARATGTLASAYSTGHWTVCVTYLHYVVLCAVRIRARKMVLAIFDEMHCLSIQLELTHYTFQHVRFCLCGLPRDEQFFYLPQKCHNQLRIFVIASLFHTACLNSNLWSQTLSWYFTLEQYPPILK